MTKALRRIGVVITAAYTSPFFLCGFVYQVACNWFEFGRNSADRAGDEWI